MQVKGVTVTRLSTPKSPSTCLAENVEMERPIEDKTTLETSGEDGKNTLETSGEDGKNTLETSGEDESAVVVVVLNSDLFLNI